MREINDLRRPKRENMGRGGKDHSPNWEKAGTENGKISPRMDTNEHGCRKGTVYKEAMKTGKETRIRKKT